MTIYFDMDGTIANTYEVENWLPKIRGNDPSPYIDAKPIDNMNKVIAMCVELNKKGCNFGAISWLSKEGTNKDYDRTVRQAKVNWLKKHFPIPLKEVHIIKYGTSKRQVAGCVGDILIDDDIRNITQWVKKGRKGRRIGIHCQDSKIIVEELYQLLKKL